MRRERSSELSACGAGGGQRRRPAAGRRMSTRAAAGLAAMVAGSALVLVAAPAAASGGLFQPAVTYAVGSAPVGIVAADLNGDGKLDLVVTNQASDTFSVLLNSGSGTFSSASLQLR